MMLTLQGVTYRIDEKKLLIGTSVFIPTIANPIELRAELRRLEQEGIYLAYIRVIEDDFIGYRLWPKLQE